MPKSVQEVADEYGIPAIFGVALGCLKPTWDGETLRVIFPATSRNPEHLGWLYHEVAHHLIASEDARKLPNYGLGTDPGHGGVTPEHPEVWRSSSAKIDEGAACVLNILLMVEDGTLSDEDIRAHAEDYCIDSLSTTDLEILAKVGFPQDRVLNGAPGFMELLGV
jgi:hypothetical protein